jgi:hypothetical protein
MRFNLGRIPENPDFHPEEQGWTALREPGVAGIFAIALPVGILLFLLAVLMLYLAIGREATDFRLVPLVASILLVMPVHEAAHLLALPHAGLSPEAVVGFWPAAVGFYVYYDGALTRRHYLLVSISPYLWLSVLPVVVCFVFEVYHPVVTYVVLANAAAAGADMAGFALVAAQVPRRALVRNQGVRTWWKRG